MDPQTMVMAFPFAAVAAAVLPGLVDGIVGNNQQKRQVSADRKRELRERYYFGRDRQNERLYSEKRLADDRRYAEGVTSSDRKYAQGIYKRDRSAFVRDRVRDEKEFKTDRRTQQRLSDQQAERSAQSRRLDFKRLRDDAMAAGYNPLTALQFATSYARDVDYRVEGGVYAGNGALGPGGGGAPSTSAGPGAVPGSSAYSSYGGGYSSQTSAPILSSRDSLLQAASDGILTYFNETRARDQETYRSIEQQVAAGQLARQLEAQNPYQGFGYTTRQPFQPHVDHSSGAGLNTPLGGTMVPSVGDDAQDFENRYGEVVGEAMGIGNAVRDVWDADPIWTAPWIRPGSVADWLTGSRPTRTPFAAAPSFGSGN